MIEELTGLLELPRYMHYKLGNARDAIVQEHALSFQDVTAKTNSLDFVAQSCWFQCFVNLDINIACFLIVTMRIASCMRCQSIFEELTKPDDKLLQH